MNKGVGYLVSLFIMLALVACGGGGSSSSSSSSSSSGGVPGSCTGPTSPYVTAATECWEYSSSESVVNANTHCSNGGGTKSNLACSSSGVLASCFTSTVQTNLTQTYFFVYWYGTVTCANAQTACTAIGGGAITPSGCS